MAIVLVVAVLWLAFSNGSNDLFKGVATLYGSGRASYRKALAWASVTTIAGALSAVALGSGLAAKFSGKGLVSDGFAATPGFALAVGIAAAATVLLATRVGLPISTTHALIGALIGAGLASAGDVRLAALWKSFVLPLLLSPLLSLALTAALWWVASRLRARSGLEAESCICVAVPAAAQSVAAAQLVGAPLVVASKEGCGTMSASSGVTARQALDSLHFLSAGAVGFARGLNDAPKIAALAGAASLVSTGMAAAFVAAAMVLGGLVGARRVAERMSHGITGMNEEQGFAANLVTAGLVLAASFAALPVSTTHVSVGALFGIGAARGDARRRAIISILLAWLVTAPVALLLAAALARLLMRS